MEIILAKTCEALSGSLNKKHGYYIRQQKQKNGRVYSFFMEKQFKESFLFGGAAGFCPAG